ncbi:MAG: putative peptidase family [Nitrobacter vulgaris]|nr:putative peptidase family [Nitrobacter vulgaris]
MNGTASRKTSGARLWFVIHGWLALPIWAFLFFVCLIGSIATVSQEIMWLASPMVRANAPTSDTRLLGYDEILAAVEREVPVLG